MNKRILSVIILLNLVSNTISAQLGAFRLRGSSNAINIGYINYRYLTFGIGNNGSADGKYSIEHWNDGLNFWKPWPSLNSGNYNLFVSDVWKTCVNMKNDNVNSTNYLITNNFQVRGYGQAHGWWTWSDSTLKRNIQTLDDGLSKLLKLKPIKYYYKENNTITGVPTEDADSIKNLTIQQDRNRTNPIDTNPSALRFGFSAQEIESVFPNLVSNSAQQKSVNYMELIPILVNAIKEQQQTILSLYQEIENWKGRSIDTTLQNQSRLFQNNPNPFDGSTIISYFIDENTTINSATIEVRDIMGNLKNTITLGDRSGMGRLDYDASSLNIGYYIYTLKINGCVKDSKMFLKEN